MTTVRQCSHGITYVVAWHDANPDQQARLAALGGQKSIQLGGPACRLSKTTQSERDSSHHQVTFSAPQNITRTGRTFASLQPEWVSDRILVDTAIKAPEDLPNFLARRVLPAGQEYHGTKILVLDSLQGPGLPATATKRYQSLYAFNDLAKLNGIVIVLVGHVTKAGQIAGPKNLEHNVDCVIYLRRAFRLRPFFVPKNRFGPAVVNPVVLQMDLLGRLQEVPHQTARSTTAYGYAGLGDELAEAQAMVSLPAFGSRPSLSAPFLPRNRIRQLVTVLGQLEDVDLSDLSYNLNCFLPAGQPYRGELDLPIAVSLLASYLQRGIPEDVLFVGELDLQARVRRPDVRYLATLEDLVVNGNGLGPRRMICAPSTADWFRTRARRGNGSQTILDFVDLVSAASLQSVVAEVWPDIGRQAARSSLLVQQAAV